MPKWSKEEDVSFMLQMLHQFLAAGAKVDYKQLHLPGRTEKALKHKVAEIKKEAEEAAAKAAEGGGQSAAGGEDEKDDTVAPKPKKESKKPLKNKKEIKDSDDTPDA